MRLVLGLGNPGARYQRTRHNAGFMVIDTLARRAQTGGWMLQCHSAVCRVRLEMQEVLLAKPLTFMNDSGRAVRLLMSRFRITPKDMILILDDLNLSFGRIRIRERGSSGGHRGLESVLQALESDEFIRVRLGIGEENMPENKAEFVLLDVPRERAAAWEEMIDGAAQAVHIVITEGVARAMSVVNA